MDRWPTLFPGERLLEAKGFDGGNSRNNMRWSKEHQEGNEEGTQINENPYEPVHLNRHIVHVVNIRIEETQPAEMLLQEAEYKSQNIAPDHTTTNEHHSLSEERRVGKECRSRWSPYH